MAKIKYQTLTGMHDILPDDWVYFKAIEKVIEDIANYYNFQRINLPILENVELFLKGTGTVTDIVEKEMYAFRTKGGEMVALRPEITPSMVRAYIQHGMVNLPQPVKLWTIGPCFRHEKPQAGRYREFNQFDFEAIGDKDPAIDAQIILITYLILKELGFKDLTIEINSIGCLNCRSPYKRILINYFKSKRAGLCADCQRRLKENPLRIFDCKEEKCQRLKLDAPQLVNHLCEECHQHFKNLLEFLDELELPYNLNPYLVRGLDYYTKTVFEIIEKSAEGAIQGTLVGGGRYDNLVKLFGGKDTPACGSAGGIERIINMMKAKKIRVKEEKEKPKIFLAQLGTLAKRRSLKIFEQLRKAKIPIGESFSKDSLRAQLKTADKMNAKWVLIFGQKEALEGFVTLRDMESGVQKEIKLDNLISELKKKLKKSNNKI